MINRLLTTWVALVVTTAAFGQTITFTDQTELDVRIGAPVHLLPDGKQVYWIDRLENPNNQRKYGYYIAATDGTDKRLLFETAIEIDDLLGFSMTNACVSPSGEKLAVMTTHNGKPWDTGEGGQPIIDIVDQQGKQLHRLPTEFGILTSPVFLDEHTVVFCDNTNPDEDRNKVQTKLQRMNLKTGKVETLKHFEKTFVTCLRLSPDGKRVVGIRADFGREEDMELFTYRLADGHMTAVKPGRMDDTYIDGPPTFSWSADGRHVFGVVYNDGAGQSLFRFTPDAEEDKRLTMIELKADAKPGPAPKREPAEQVNEAIQAKARQLIVQLGAPGFADREAAQEALVDLGKPALPLVIEAKQSDDAEVALRAEEIERRIKGLPEPHGHETVHRDRVYAVSMIDDEWLSVVRHTEKFEGFAVNAATGKVIAVAPPLLVIDRAGDRLLLADLARREVHSATVTVSK